MRIAPRKVIATASAIVTTGLMTATAVAAGPHVSATVRGKLRHSHAQAADPLPQKTMDRAMQLSGSYADGVFGYSFDRSDLTNITLGGVPIKPSFQLMDRHEFQPLGGNQAFLNGDLPVPTADMDKTIHAITSTGLTFQAEHQHFYDFSPMVWFIHLRGRGNAVTLTRAVHKVLEAARTPLPQSSPQNPTTPFNVGGLKNILHAYDSQTSSDGVVTLFVSRRSPIYIDGVKVKPAANIATNVSFEPLNSSGSQAAAVPDLRDDGERGGSRGLDDAVPRLGHRLSL